MACIYYFDHIKAEDFRSSEEVYLGFLNCSFGLQPKV